MPVPVPATSSPAAAATPSAVKPAPTSAPAAATSRPAVHTPPVAVPASSNNGVKTVAPSQSGAKAASAQPSASQGAANAGSDSKGVSNGGIAGIVVALIVGIIVVGCLAGYFWRKHKQREYNTKNSWHSMGGGNRDDDITPFPARSSEPKPTPYRDDDVYGGNNVAPVGNGRALAMARQNAFFDDGTPRPDSGIPQYGAARSYGPYPAAPTVAAYSNDRSYSPPQQAAPQYQDYPFIQNGGYPVNSTFSQQQDEHNPFADIHASSETSPQNGPRQLVGPGANAAYGAAAALTPVPLGRPQPPTSYDDIASAEQYADDRYADDHLPAPPQIGRSAGYDDIDPETYTPRTAASDEWAGGAAPGAPGAVRTSDISRSSPLPEPAPLPTLRPMSPLMGGLGISDEAPKTIPAKAFKPALPPAPTFTDDKSRDMYSEVARYAGVATPVTPATPHVVDTSSPPITPIEHSQIMQASRLPAPAYQHGQPLSPLTEVSTPQSTHVPLVPDTPAAQAPAVPSPAAAAAPPTHRRLPTPPKPVTTAADDADDAYGGI